eukprot:gene26881-33530_t
MLLLLLVIALVGQFRPRHPSAGHVQVDLKQGTRPGTLYVMVHGLRLPCSSAEQQWNEISATMLAYGDVAKVKYNALPWSNASASLVAQEISHQVQARWDSTRHGNVVVIGNSMGALLARRAILHSLGKPNHPVPQGAPVAWASKIERVVLLAGMNRGWDLSGEKPADMRWPGYAAISFMSWLGRLSGSGRLMMEMEAGSPFVADLRMDWMSRLKTPGHNLQTVQLLGDIDEIVSSEDNQDLNVAGHDDFAWIKVRGTGHADITDFDESESSFDLGAYRRTKFLAAADLNTPFPNLERESEVPPASKDAEVTRVVFVMHGIRDLGRWSSAFEKELQQRHSASGACGKLAIASIRYGYFGMGQFLLRRDREKYVRWFMDQYTETLARYPGVKEIHFVGHSNGTYLLAKALELYPSMKIDKVVLAGSVIRKDYDWRKRFDLQQVKAVRNYVAYDDWVVALFPRFFEQRMASWMNGDIGSAGFNGFDAGRNKELAVENLGYISGAHGAFQNYVQAIAAKSLKEVRYHLRHSRDWLVRLGDGTERSHAKAQTAIDQLLPYTQEFWSASPQEAAAQANGTGIDMTALQANWNQIVDEALTQATLQRPAAGGFVTTGKQGIHSEHLGFVLAEMQTLARQHPGATCDPEIPVVSLRELGILRDVREGAQGLEVVITPTYSGCPAMGQIEDDVKAALSAGGLQATVVTQLAPAWTTDWMTEAAKDKLRAYGIAPPHACASAPSGGANVVQFAARGTKTEVVHCPQCGSANTTETSHFGSTACKALYRCLDCMEPFDYFKPY